MYPVLILRAEFVCLVILVFLFFTSRAYNVDRESKSFRRILTFALIHVVFDIVTALTVNNTGTVPPGINRICHIIFYLSAIMFSCELANYVIAKCYPRNAKRFYAAGHIIAAAYICCLPFLTVVYEPDVGTYSSAGSAAYVGYVIAFLFFISALVIMFINWDRMSAPIKSTLVPMMIVLIICEISQIIWRSLLFTGCAVTIVTVGFFFSLENPVQVFKRKAMTDALTGVRSRSSYETDIAKLDMDFKKNPGDEYIFVFCDIDDLRGVNNRFGHPEGDNYIILIASSISRCMAHASSVYRIGGDEFLISYYKTDESIVLQEIADLQAACRKAGADLKYSPSVSAGWAKSSEKYRSLRDVVKSADYSMYRNKAESKTRGSYDAASISTELDYTGLTDKIFDAMCSSNDRFYPYITNLETNVTRISPAWKEYFGLESEFFSDFNSVWEPRIHPDYISGYRDDIAAVLNGHKDYHNYEYYARKADGEYVRVSCHGALYRSSSDDDCSYFSGFIVNYGPDKVIGGADEGQNS